MAGSARQIILCDAGEAATVAMRFCLDHLPAQPVADISKKIDIEMAKQRLSRSLVDCNPLTSASRLLDDHDFTHDTTPNVTGGHAGVVT
jgi:hypothetical protein